MKACRYLSVVTTAVLLITALASVGSAQDAPAVVLLSPEDEQLTEGDTYDITWSANGIKTVALSVRGDYTDYAEGRRGRFIIPLGDPIPAEQGGITWRVPFLDTVEFILVVKGYGEDGNLLGKDERMYVFRPDFLKTRTEDGIYIDVRRTDRQRLYVVKDGRLVKAYLTSASMSHHYYPRNIHPSRPHDHYGVFCVRAKYPVWHSRLYGVRMPWAMNYCNGHFIHATSPNFYGKLGTAASHGCNRLTMEQAKELYDTTPIGTRVEIIAK